jgi:hypothetical protein
MNFDLVSNVCFYWGSAGLFSPIQRHIHDLIDDSYYFVECMNGSKISWAWVAAELTQDSSRLKARWNCKSARWIDRSPSTSRNWRNVNWTRERNLSYSIAIASTQSLFIARSQLVGDFHHKNKLLRVMHQRVLLWPHSGAATVSAPSHIQELKLNF